MRKSLTKSLRFNFFVYALLLTLLTSATYYSLQSLLNSSDKIDQSRELVRSLNKLMSNLRDAEIGQRGYLITGDTAYLRPYTASIETKTDLLNEIKLHVENSDKQAKNFVTLTKLVDAHYILLKESIAQKKLLQ